MNPGVPQPGLLPIVISFRPSIPTEYNNGFRNPSGGSPLERRASLSSETIPAKVGAEAEVPAAARLAPSKMTWNLSD